MSHSRSKRSAPRQDRAAPGPFPSTSAISDSLGVPLPDAWISLLRIAHARAKTLDDLLSHFDSSLSLIFSGSAIRAFGFGDDTARAYGYGQTPPEFIELGHMGCDGVTYGLINRTPEIAEPDPVIAELSPMDSESICLLGKNTLEAIENLASFALQSAHDEDDDEALADFTQAHKPLIAELGIKPSRRLANRRFARDGNGRPLPVRRLPGYRHVTTPDGIGVQAPKTAFGPEPSAEILHHQAPLEALTAAAKDAMSEQHPATALQIAKSAWWWSWTNQPTRRALAPIMADAYAALARPQYAKIILDQAARLDEQNAESERRRSRPDPNLTRLVSPPKL